MILAAILALGSLTAKAQMRSGVDTLTLDQVKYRITYDAKQVNDTTQTPYIYRRAQMRLDIGNNITHFYNLSHLQWEQQVLPMILSGGNIDLRKAVPVKCMNWEFFKNYPKKGETMFEEVYKMNNYCCLEKTEKAEVVSQSDLTKIKQMDDGEELFRDIKSTDENGKPIKLKPRKRIFNPIER